MESFKVTRTRFEEFMQSQGHSKKTLEHYQWILSCLEGFMQEKGIHSYSFETGIIFEKERLASVGSARQLQQTRLVIRRLNDFLKGEFHILPPSRISVPDCHAPLFRAFLDNLKLQGLRSSSIQGYYYSGAKTLRSFYQNGIVDLSELAPAHIYTVFAASNDKMNEGSFLRKFLRFLFKGNILPLDYSIIVPTIRSHKPVPSVYTKAETVQLLDSIDTNRAPGKRNHAIILLALRLGIRCGDIVNLELSNIHFDSNTIEFVQRKTNVPQRFELLPELKSSITEYVSCERPATSCTKLFISTRPPFRPITVMAVTSLITRHMSQSGITTKERKKGGHALRMTLASELISEKVPYGVVRKILGHEDTKSMKHYVKFDVEMLRPYALESLPFTGLYARYINENTGGSEDGI